MTTNSSAITLRELKQFERNVRTTLRQAIDEANDPLTRNTEYATRAHQRTATRNEDNSAPGARPKRSRDQIVRDIMAACNRGIEACRGTRPAANDDDPDMIPPLASVPRRTVTPINPLTAGDSRPVAFRRAPFGIAPRVSIAASFQKAVDAAGAAMRKQFRPAGC